MDPQTQKEPISRLAYVIISILAIIQGIIITANLDYSTRTSIELSPTLAYLPLILAIFVPSVISFLITNAKQSAFYLNIILVIVLACWINTWQSVDLEYSSSRDPFLVGVTLTVLIFFLLPWMQNYQATGTWKANYGCLVGYYFRNTLFGITSCAIGGLLALIVKQASFLFSIVNLSALSHLLDSEYTLWVAFLLGFNISLLFLRAKLVMQLNNIVRYFSLFFLPLLSVVAIIFLIGFVISLATNVRFTSSELGSGTMLGFIILNVIFINAVYGDGTHRHQFGVIFNSFVLTSIVLLNAFSALSLYGILVRVNQYSWSVSRLYAFTIAIFLALIILSYSIAILRKRQSWSLSLGSINKVAISSLIGIILIINSPIANFEKITVNSMMSAIEQGKIKINRTLGYDLENLGKRGQDALAKLNQNPEYQMLLKTSDYSPENQKLLKDVLVMAKNSKPIPQSWFSMGDDISGSWYCTNYYSPQSCLGFMADVNQDGHDDIVMCHSEAEISNYECIIWQSTADTWNVIEEQITHFDDIPSKKAAWDKLLNGQYQLKPKAWLEITTE
ncbi:DUF7057 domain-containing protein [Providencia rustigianii]|uniref:DUF7057 domain-containing protein n=1 Tax=Providencia rustigianii TaxID=158850 RepID=UPI00224077E6|nr:DUF4153 domain-containing protein [Providencia rustigianii]